MAVDIDAYNLNPAEKDKLKKAVQEAVDIRYKMDGYKDLLKEIQEMVKDELDIKPKDFNKIVKIIKEDKVTRFDDEHRIILDLLETVVHTPDA